MFQFIIISVFFSFSHLCECTDLKFSSVPIPKFGKYYSVGGVITLPYAEINEPFFAWYDSTAKRSRIDYYGGVVKTYQRGDIGKYGELFKLAPMTTEKVLNVMTCFRVNGTSPGPSVGLGDSVATQSVLPDLTGFTWSRQEPIGGNVANVWTKKNTVYGRIDSYTMWTDVSTGAPLRYDMIGFDSLLGSHYDRYYITYMDYNQEKPLESIFEVPNNKSCGGFPGPGDQSEHQVQANPMSEWITHGGHHIDTTHLNPKFDRFRHKHSRQYQTNKETNKRRHIFRQNLRFISSVNRQGLTYSLGVNHLADRTDAELKVLRGKLYSTGYNGGSPVTFSREERRKLAAGLPDSIDWRIMGAVSPVKDQAVCGSCWSFGTTGALEGAVFTKHGSRVRLSQQQLMDCSWGFGNNACDGGEDFRSYQYVMKHGLSLESDYGSYLGQDGYCRQTEVKSALNMSSYMNITQGNLTQLAEVLATKGPVSVSIDASLKTFSYYSSGVYYDVHCRHDPEGLDHSVLAVGYGTLKGEKYWLVKK